MDKYLEPLLQAGLVRREGDGYRVQSDHPVVPALRRLLRALESLPDEDLR